MGGATRPGPVKGSRFPGDRGPRPRDGPDPAGAGGAGVSVPRARGMGRAGAQRRSCRPRYPRARGDGDGRVSARGDGTGAPGASPAAAPPTSRRKPQRRRTARLCRATSAPGVRPKRLRAPKGAPTSRASSRPTTSEAGAAVPARKTGSPPASAAPPQRSPNRPGRRCARTAGASPRGCWCSRRRAPPSPASRAPAGQRRDPDLTGGAYTPRCPARRRRPLHRTGGSQRAHRRRCAAMAASSPSGSKGRPAHWTRTSPAAGARRTARAGRAAGPGQVQRARGGQVAVVARL